MTNILGLIPARGGSKGIPNKNIIELAGKPLINYTIEAALNANQVNSVVVSTDSQTIADIARSAGADIPFLRPAEFSTDESSAVDVVMHAINFHAEQNKAFDYIVYLQPTSPLRTAVDIDNAIKQLSLSDADSLVSVMDVPHQFGLDSLMVEGNGFVRAAKTATDTTRRQEKTAFVARNGPAIVITKPSTIQTYKNLYGEKIAAYKMPANRSADIDCVDDLDYIDWLIQKNKSLS